MSESIASEQLSSISLGSTNAPETHERTSSVSMLSRLGSLSTCDISDALVKLGSGSGGLLTDMHIFSPIDLTYRIVGPVFTVKMVSAKDKTSPKPSEHFVDACPAGSVMLIQAPEGSKSACWGGLMSTAARTKGIQATIIDGGCRDLLEHRELNYPVIARHHSTLGQSTFTRPSQFNCPLIIKPIPPHSVPPFPDTVVMPGDILVADLDGVVVIPKGKVEEVVRLAERGKEIDERIAKDLKAGSGVGEAMARWR